MLNKYFKLDCKKSCNVGFYFLHSIQEIFEAIPKLKDNPLVQRVVEVFDADQSGGVDFKEFVLGNPQFIFLLLLSILLSFSLVCSD